MANMIEDTEKRPATPPNMSGVTLYNFVDTHRKTLPNRIDRTLMKSVAGGDQARIISALQFLKLIKEDGKPRAGFEHLRDAKTEDEVKAAWADVLREAYSDVFNALDLSSATQGQLEETFKDAYKIQGDTVRKAITFFLHLARSAGIPLSSYFKATRKRGPRTPGTPKQKAQQTIRPNGVGEQDEEPYDNRNAEIDRLLLDKFPAFDPTWSSEVQAKWFDAFGKLQEQLKN